VKIHNPVLRFIREYGIITVGCAILAVAVNWFYTPNGISVGGFTGIGQIFNRIVPSLPVGMTSLALNIPLFIIWGRKRGFRLMAASLYAAVVSSLMIDGLKLLYTFSPMEPLLACVYGGVLTGLSDGLMLRVEATTGGTSLLARLLKYRLPALSIGKLCLIVDVLVVILYAIIFRSVENALCGIISMYICSIVTDMVVYGTANAKVAYIISPESEAIKDALLKMDMGVTLLSGRGGFSGQDRQMVFCTIRRRRLPAIKAAVTEIDPKAFIIVCDAREVLGEGFGEYSPDNL